MAAVQSPIIPIVAEMVHRSPGTISLGQGVVSYGPPPEALAALRESFIESTDHTYGRVEGMPALVEAIRKKLAADNGVNETAPRREIAVTAGSNMGFLSAVLAVTRPGDEVILPSPYYFNHEMAIVIAGCRPVPVATGNRYDLRVDAIARAVTARTRAIVTVSPNNPSGAVYPEAALREVSALCLREGIYHVSDEAYEYFTYGGARHFSPASIDAAARWTISLYSMSKTYGMAGWRIGYMVIPVELSEAVMKIQDTILICPPVASQQLALAALNAGSSYCRARVAELDSVRLMVLDRLGGLGDIVSVVPPEGAFYFLVRVNLPLDPFALVARLVSEHKVAAVPGTAFGLVDGCYLRVSYGALSADTVAEGIGRLADGLAAIAAEMKVR